MLIPITSSFTESSLKKIVVVCSCERIPNEQQERQKNEEKKNRDTERIK